MGNREIKSILKTDFDKQAKLELTPEIFQFSKIIRDFEFVLSIFDEDPEISSLTEDELRAIIKKELPKIQKYFIDRI